MQAVCIGSVTGVIVATLAYLAANRLLPADPTLQGWRRPQLEVLVFFLGWAACFVHAAWRGSRAWREQACAIAVLACGCAVLNMLTTAASSAVWEVDAALLAGALLAAVCAHRLRRR